jgi:ACS family hexuronate transporter-like MFS transporter
MMPGESSRITSHFSSWKWWICGLLLLASALNYMDRQTLANASVRITREFGLSQEQYGNLEFSFGWAFAAGSLAFGWLADRFPVRWVYPAAVALWSATGFFTGGVRDYSDLWLARTFLGFFEGGHWPCAVKTTQYLLAPSDRSMGNSVLQSGTSIGAILTPLIMNVILTEEAGSWRPAFQWIGLSGMGWIVAWFLMVRPGDLATARPPVRSEAKPVALWRILCGRRMWVIIGVVALINTAWQTLRAWLPKFLQEGRGYEESATLYFNSLFYLATDVGVIGAGALTLWLFRRGTSVFQSRLRVFGGCALLSLLTVFVPWMGKSWLLLGVLLAVGAGTLGVFPIYHAFTQDVSPTHQGKVSGIGGVAAWALAPPVQKLYGRLIDRTGSFDLGLGLAGILTIAAFLLLWLGWPRENAAHQNP